MEFKSITIKNFLSYYDVNEIEFSDTTTIFIGQNNTGKSKIFDAINFALYERVWITDKGENGSWVSTDREIASFILNNHKKNIALAGNDETVEVSVSLEMDTGSNFITAERTYFYKRNEKEHYQDLYPSGRRRADGCVQQPTLEDGRRQRCQRRLCHTGRHCLH